MVRSIWPNAAGLRVRVIPVVAVSTTARVGWAAKRAVFTYLARGNREETGIWRTAAVKSGLVIPGAGAGVPPVIRGINESGTRRLLRAMLSFCFSALI